MSAFICSVKQVAVVAKALVEYDHSGADYGDVAKELGALNVRSVAHRYNTDLEGATQDFVGQSYFDYLNECVRVARQEEVKTHEFSLGRLLGIIGSFLYQSCESDDCYNSALYQRVWRLEQSLESTGVVREGWSL